ncbi:biotin-dependent carboxyltransferase family protein [Rodentibacter myodis]|uniref:Carboxyltransferase domain-containing protein n=1 Tax=Rodentibacter myodis TaxID=1907939 RepID=A0A1V3JRU6_9PAST|nr:biotin-dependent carboxyltransferase family protein [Rodentibacter myodis]OOF59018.1 hypothetical protein BKL49_05630 [Rodentibacter myodis]
MIEILAIQARATVQDLGRFGYRHLGISHSGAMDKLALQAGNLLLGNDPNCAAIEIALSSVRVKFLKSMAFCVTGAFYEMNLDDKPIYAYCRYYAEAGQILTLHRAKIGMYGYLCVQGGIDVPLELGSAATDIRATLGGVAGRYLQQGDGLKTYSDSRKLCELAVAPIPLKDTIYAVPSSEYDDFKRKSQYHWWQGKWTLQSNSDRMGYRFQGDPLELMKPLEMLSHAIQFGTVQVPPNGQPIILMADAQTTGGYPKIANIIDADLGRLAQIRLGSTVKFEMVNLAQATKYRRQNEVYLNHIRRIVDATR